MKNLVGSRRTVDVMDCKTQKNCQMTMKEWEDYYNHDNGTEGAGSAQGVTEGTSEDPVDREEAQPPQESGILTSLFQELRERSKFALKVLPQRQLP